MTTLTVKTHIPDDRKLTLQLPPNVTPGEHRVRVQIDPLLTDDELDDDGETPLRWEGGVLVYAGEVPPGSVCDWIEQAREERMKDILRGSSSCE